MTDTAESPLSSVLKRIAIGLAIIFLPLLIALGFLAPLAIPYFVLGTFFIISLVIKNRIAGIIIILPLAFIGKCDGGHVQWVNQIDEYFMCGTGTTLEVKTIDLSPKRGSQKGMRPGWSCKSRDGSAAVIDGDRGQLIHMASYLAVGFALFLITQVLKLIGVGAAPGNSSPARPGGMTQPVMNPPGAESLEEVRDLLIRGKKIQAIKLYRKLSGVGLKEAKDAVDKMEKS